jgi:hypothetical protein
MFKRLNSTLIIAMFTGSALIAFAFFESHIKVSATTLDVAAAIICVAPVLFAPAWRKACRNKTSNAR